MCTVNGQQNCQAQSLFYAAKVPTAAGESNVYSQIPWRVGQNCASDAAANCYKTVPCTGGACPPATPFCAAHSTADGQQDVIAQSGGTVATDWFSARATQVFANLAGSEVTGTSTKNVYIGFVAGDELAGGNQSAKVRKAPSMGTQVREIYGQNMIAPKAADNPDGPIDWYAVRDFSGNPGALEKYVCATATQPAYTANLATANGQDNVIAQQFGGYKAATACTGDADSNCYKAAPCGTSCPIGQTCAAPATADMQQNVIAQSGGTLATNYFAATAFPQINVIVTGPESLGSLQDQRVVLAAEQSTGDVRSVFKAAMMEGQALGSFGQNVIAPQASINPAGIDWFAARQCADVFGRNCFMPSAFGLSFNPPLELRILIDFAAGIITGVSFAIYGTDPFWAANTTLTLVNPGNTATQAVRVSWANIRPFIDSIVSWHNVWYDNPVTNVNPLTVDAYNLPAVQGSICTNALARPELRTITASPVLLTTTADNTPATGAQGVHWDSTVPISGSPFETRTEVHPTFNGGYVNQSSWTITQMIEVQDYPWVG